MDIEKRIDEMRALKDYRQEQLDLKGRLGQVLDIKYLGDIVDENGLNKDIYLVIEKIENNKGELVIFEKYYSQDFEFLGINNQDNKVIKTYDKTDNIEVQKQLEDLEIEGIMSLEDLEKDRLEELALLLGISAEEIESIDEIDLEVMLKEKDGKTNQELEQKSEEEQEEIISKEDVAGIDIKSETSTETWLKGETLGKKLNLEEGACKIGIVSSSSINKLTGDRISNPYTFVVILNDGSVKKLGEDVLKLRNQGENKQQLTIERDSDVENESKIANFEIANRNNEFLQIGYDGKNDGIPEKVISYAIGEEDSNDKVAYELPKNRTYPSPKNRETLNDRSDTREADRMIERNDKIKKDTKREVGDIDDIQGNESGKKIYIDQIALRRAAREILDRDNGLSRIYNAKDIEDALMNKLIERDAEFIDENIVNLLEEEMIEKGEKERTRGDNRA